MVAFHYPPCTGTSGIHRTVKFAQHLPAHGWTPVVLTAHPRAYPPVRGETYYPSATATPVHRAFVLDTARHLSIKGLYPRWLALPDRWISWAAGAVPLGLSLVRKYRPDVIFSTYPITTAHLIGSILQQVTGLPWIADFRDPMTEEQYPPDPLVRRCRRWVEARTVGRADRIVMVTPATMGLYRERYPFLGSERLILIPNGYDEEDFASLIPGPLGLGGDGGDARPLRLLHAGAVTLDERDPRPFFRALSRLKREGRISSRTLSVNLRPASPNVFGPILRELDIEDVVSIHPALEYRKALQECAEADGLLLLQGQSCDRQIPAKAYEYLRLRRPILGLVGVHGDAARLLRETGGATVVDIHREDELYAAIPSFLETVRRGKHPAPDSGAVSQFTREHQAGILATCLDDVMANRESAAPATSRGSAEEERF